MRTQRSKGLQTFKTHTFNMRGLTLLELLVSSLIVGIVFFSFITSFTFMGNSMKSMDAKNSRSELTDLMLTHLRNPAVLSHSSEAPANENLRICLGIAGSSPCTHLEEQEFEFRGSVRDLPVLDAYGAPVLDATTGQPVYQARQIGGSSSLTCTDAETPGPVFYTIKGESCGCNQPASLCPFQVVTSFKPVCATGSTCSRAQAFNIRYRVQLRSDVPESLKTQHFASFRPEQGEKIVDLSLEDEFFVQFDRANTFVLDPIDPSLDTAYQGLTRAQIRQGVLLPYRQPGRGRFEIMYNAPTAVSRIQLSRHVYNTVCQLTDIGVDSNCQLPNSGNFIEVATLNVSNTLYGRLELVDDLSMGRHIVDYRLRALDSSDNIILESPFDLRVFHHNTGALTVSPPNPVVMSCTSPSNSNNFAFKAEAIDGWQELVAEFSPPHSGGVEYPNFNSLFDKTSSAIQDLAIDHNLFTPAGNYNITFRGRTHSGVIATASSSFAVAPLPPMGIVDFPSPAVNSTIRQVSDLNLNFLLNLPCGRTLSSATIRISQSSGDVLPSRNITANCVSEAGSEDRNQYRCQMVMPCNEWLNVADPSQCSTVFSTQTNLTLHATATDSTNQVFTRLVPFRVSAKLSLNINRDFVEWVQLSSPGFPSMSTTIVPVRIDLSANLEPSDSIPIQMVGSAVSSTNHICRTSAAGGSVEALYYTNPPRCILNMRVPNPVPGDSIQLVLGDTDRYQIAGESVVTINQYTSSVLACENNPLKPSCSGGQTLKQKITHRTINGYNTTFAGEFSTHTNRNFTYSLENDDSILEFYMIAQPIFQSGLPSMRPRIEVSKEVTPVPSYFSSHLEADPSQNIRCESNTRCPTQLVRFPAHQFNSAKDQFKPPIEFRVQFNATGSNTSVQFPRIEALIIQECYCD